MRNGYLINVFTSFDFEEIAKTGGKVIEIYEGVFFVKILKYLLLEMLLIKNLLWDRTRDENNDVMQFLVKVFKDILYGEQLRKFFNEKYACKWEALMMTENDEKVRDYSKISYGIYIVKLVEETGSEVENKNLYTMPLNLGSFASSNSQRILNNFSHTINGFHTKDVCCTDTDSLNVEDKHWFKLDKAGLLGKELLQG